MFGRIIDMDTTDAYVSFEDGTTLDVGLAHIPQNSKVGDSVNIELNNTKMNIPRSFSGL